MPNNVCDPSNINNMIVEDLENSDSYRSSIHTIVYSPTMCNRISETEYNRLFPMIRANITRLIYDFDSLKIPTIQVYCYLKTKIYKEGYSNLDNHERNLLHELTNLNAHGIILDNYTERHQLRRISRTRPRLRLTS
jgi:hypothetical protein